MFIKVSILSCFVGLLSLAKGQNSCINHESKFLWAQQLTGLDLAHTVSLSPIYSPKIGIIDSGFFFGSINKLYFSDDLKRASLKDTPEFGFNELGPAAHGTIATNVMFGPFPFGFSNSISQSKIVFFFDVLQKQDFGYPMDKNTPIDILCSSTSTESPANMKVFREIEKNGAVVVLTSGNDHPFDLVARDHLGSIRNFPYIRTGAISPSGAIAHYSSKGDNVSVVAPSGENGLYVKSDNGFLGTFSGTSFAQPVVCSAVQMMMTDLGKLTVDEVNLLIKNTSLPVINKDKRSTGFGLINFYKLRQVAKKIREQGWDNKLNSQEKMEILAKPATYDFDDEAEFLASQAAGGNDNCVSFNLLRKAFFLTGKTKFADTIIGKKDFVNKNKSANYYHSVSSRSVEYILMKISHSKNADEVKSAYRALGEMNEISFEVRKRVASSINFNIDTALAQFLATIISLKLEEREILIDIITTRLERLGNVDKQKFWHFVSRETQPIVCLPEIKRIKDKLNEISKRIGSDAIHISSCERSP